MAIVQKPLPGLAKFLGQETQGQIKLDMPGTLFPVLEAEDFISPNKWFIQTFNLALTAGNSAWVTVPAKKFWRLKWGGVHYGCVAGQWANIVPALRKTTPGGTQYALPLFTPFIQNSPAGNQFIVGQNQYGGLCVPLDKMNAEPGDQVGILLLAVAGAANVTGHFFFQYQELDL